jgi:hypothetical protein
MYVYAHVQNSLPIQAKGEGGLSDVQRERGNSVQPLKKLTQVLSIDLVPPLTKEK